MRGLLFNELMGASIDRTTGSLATLFGMALIEHHQSHLAGHQLFNLLCLDCHSVGGYLNDIRIRTRGMGPADIDAIIRTMGGDRDYMPPFPGTAQERQILVYYILEGLQKKNP